VLLCIPLTIGVSAIFGGARGATVALTDMAWGALFVPVIALAILPINLGLALASFYLPMRGFPKVFTTITLAAGTWALLAFSIYGPAAADKPRLADFLIGAATAGAIFGAGLVIIVAGRDRTVES
jgi:uncharacterized membrane-anchored protein YitT (DUF2179 family)